MRRLILGISATATFMSVAVLARSAQAQTLAYDDSDRKPRFLLASASTSKPAPVDVSRTPILKRRLSLAFDGTTVKQALAEISLQSGLKLVYSDEVLPNKGLVHLRVDGISVAAALTEVLLDANIDVMFESGMKAALVRRAPPVQKGTIAGRVTDKSRGDPLPGATVVLEGTRRSASTNSEGQYRIDEVEAGIYTVRARYIGYSLLSASVTVRAGEEATATFALEKSAQRLQDVVTAGTIVPTEVNALPTPVTIVTADDIQTQKLRRVDQVFRTSVPGAIAWELGRDDIVNSATVRGTNSLLLPSNGIKTYVDGVEAADDGWALVDVNSVERIEILRGPEASTIYGSGASGGVMQIFTKSGDLGSSRPQLEAQVSAGSVESPYASALDQTYAASIRGGAENVSYSFGGTYRHTGDWLPEYHLNAPSGYGAARLTQGPLTLGLSVRYAYKSVGQAVNPSLRAAGYPDFQPPADATLDGRNQAYGVNASYAPTTWWQHNVIVGFDRYFMDLYNTRPRDTDSLYSSTVNQQQEKVSFRYNNSAHFAFSPALQGVLTTGVEYSRFNSSLFRVSDALNNVGTLIAQFPGNPSRGIGSNTGYFAQTRLDLHDAVFVTLGIRAEQNSAFGKDYGTAVAPRAGLSVVHSFGSVTAKLRGSYGEALRPPAYSTNIDQPGLRANPTLRPEEQWGSEVGFDLTFGSWASLGATYYNQITRDLIDYVLLDATTSPATFQLQNFGRIRNSGFELEGRLRTVGLDLAAHYSLTNSVVRNLAPEYGGDLRPGDRLLGVPKHTAGVTAAYALSNRTTVNAGMSYFGSWTNIDWLALAGVFYGGQEYRGSNRDYWIRYPSVTKLNAGLEQGVGQHVSLLISVENLTNNQRFEDTNISVIPGRRTTIGARLSY